MPEDNHHEEGDEHTLKNLGFPEAGLTYSLCYRAVHKLLELETDISLVSTKVISFRHIELYKFVVICNQLLLVDSITPT